MAQAVRKKFFEVSLPLIKQKVELYSTSEEKLVGKTVKIDLTRKLRGRSLEIIFKIQENLQASPKRMHLLGYYIRRMIRKSASYVEDSFSAQCKNAVLKIKPFLITRKKVSRKVRNALKLRAKEEIEKTISNQTYEEVFSDILANKFQRSLSLKLKKVYPLAFTDIRDIEVEKTMRAVKIKEEKVK